MSTLIQPVRNQFTTSLPLRFIPTGNEFRIDKDKFIQAHSYAIKDYEIIEKDMNDKPTGVSQEDIRWFKDLQNNHGRKFGKNRNKFDGDDDRLPNKFFANADSASVRFSEVPGAKTPSGIIPAQGIK
jgi:hypothetical protein